MARKKVSRRKFLADAGTTAAAAAFAAHGFPTIVPRHVLGGPGYQAPSDTVNFAVAGFGGMGSGNAHTLAGWHNLAAVCDVDMAFAQRNVNDKLRARQDGTINADAIKLLTQYAKAAKYTDWREMLEKEKGIDGVVIATPDHTHAVIAKAAMELGKHVYVQKPLAWSVHECRVLRDVALKNPKVVTQMGNQGHSSEGARLINEWIAAGVIGPVREVHIWTNRPVGFWPQGFPRPNPNAGLNQAGTSWNLGRINNTIAREMGNADATPPDGFRWDLYLGPVAEDIPYHPVYQPFNWRGWLDFGGGALGDMGAHLVNHPYWALGLTYPTSIEATSTAFGTTPVPPLDPTAPRNTPAGRMRSKPVSFPLATTVHYQFPARGSMPPVKMSWFDGGLYPPRPDVLPDSEELVAEGGVIFHGEKGILINDTYGLRPRLFPESLRAAAARVPKTLPRVTVPGLAEHMEALAVKMPPQPNAPPRQPPGPPDPDRHIGSAHALNWARAIKGEAKASSPIEYAARLTETMLLGVAALRAGQGRKVYYDGEKGEFTNAPDANQYLTREYRSGWGI